MNRARAFASLAVVLLWCQVVVGEEFTGRVVGVSDGDTISVMHAGRAEKIRLHGIDAPEKGQAFSNTAKLFVSELCFGKEVKVRSHGQDRYGRTIGEILLPDSRNLNHKIVEEGFAWWFRRYAPNDIVLEKLESEARAARRGLWVQADPVPPWEWRKQKTRALEVSEGITYGRLLNPIPRRASVSPPPVGREQ